MTTMFNDLANLEQKRKELFGNGEATPPAASPENQAKASTPAK